MLGHGHDLDPSMFATSAATDEPIGTIMALHITFMVAGRLWPLSSLRFGDHLLAFGFIYPLGMVLGLARNKWHVPVDSWYSYIARFLAHVPFWAQLCGLSCEGLERRLSHKYVVGASYCPSVVCIHCHLVDRYPNRPWYLSQAAP